MGIGLRLTSWWDLIDGHRTSQTKRAEKSPEFHYVISNEGHPTRGLV